MKRRKSATDPGQLRLGFGPLSPPPNEPPPEPVVSQGLVEQLAEWCSRHQKDPKILFVPSRQIGRNLLTALAASGRSCANLTVTTPLEHALATATPALEAAGWRRLRFDADLLILSEIVIDSSSGYRRRPGPLSISLSRPHSGADKDPAHGAPADSRPCRRWIGRG